MGKLDKTPGTPKLENWTLMNHGTWSQLYGNVYGHYRFDDGEYIHTSYLKAWSMSEGKATTANTTYILGKPAGLTLEADEEDAIHGPK